MSELISKIQAVWREDRGAYDTPLNTFRCSSVGYCARRLYYDKTVPKADIKPFGLDTLGIFACGTSLHNYIQSILPDDYLIAKEKPVEYPHNSIVVVGHYDLLLLNRNGLTLTDIKSCNTRAFRFKQKEASDHHKTQANMYAGMLNVDTYSILYVEKNSFQMAEHFFPVDWQLFNDTLDKLENVYMHMQTQTPPERIVKTWECGYCPHKSTCDPPDPDEEERQIQEDRKEEE